MSGNFVEMLAVGGKSNSLGRVSEVIEFVLGDRSRLDELYDCLFDEDAWIRMRAADALEKVCREHPDWLLPYIDRFTRDGSFPAAEMNALLQIQQQHKSNAVIKRATKLLTELSAK